jgi:hypothetical protein
MSQVIDQREERLSTADFVATSGKEREQPQQLLPQDFIQDLRGKWDRIQAGFVDEPRAA